MTPFSLGPGGLGIPAWDPSVDIAAANPRYLRKGNPIHFVVSTQDQHHEALISEVLNETTGDVIVQVLDPAYTAGRYTTQASYDATGQQQHTWHWRE